MLLNCIVLPENPRDKGECFELLFKYFAEIYELKTGKEVVPDDFNVGDDDKYLILNTKYEIELKLPKDKVEVLSRTLTQSFSDEFKYDLNKDGLKEFMKKYNHIAIKDLYDNSFIQE